MKAQIDKIAKLVKTDMSTRALKVAIGEILEETGKYFVSFKNNHGYSSFTTIKLDSKILDDSSRILAAIEQKVGYRITVVYGITKL